MLTKYEEMNLAFIESEIVRKQEEISVLLLNAETDEQRKIYNSALKILKNHKTARLHWTVHIGKLGGIDSLNSSCRANKCCLARMQNGEAVCSQCFANALLAFRLCLECHMLVNTWILNSHELTDEEIPIVKYSKKKMAENPDLYVRIESYGDVSSELQCRNYAKVVRKNPDYRFTAWTKNLEFWDREIKKNGKPKNLRLGFSSLKLNEMQEIPEKYIPILDFIFTVYEKAYAEAHPEIEINCGGRHCAGCGLCYDERKCEDAPRYKNTHIIVISEILRPKKKMVQQIA